VRDILLDTHVWIWASLDDRTSLSPRAVRVMVESTQLKGFHKDPADQIIVATSRVLGVPLLTSDRRILDFPDVETIW
jgi:PIN domain nuclease of toxin-antitoxin system